MSFITNQFVTFDNNPQLDSYGRLRTTEINTVFDSPLKYHDESLLWDTILTGSGTTNFNNVETILDMTVAGSGDSVIRQTKEYFQLQTGKSHQGFLGCVFGSNSTNLTKKAGFFDNEDGFYIQNDNGAISVVVRTSITGTMQETVIPQSAWDDPMDGTGDSGISLDFSKSQIFAFDISYTGFGRVRFGVLLNGHVHVFMKIEKANSSSTNGFSTPSLPVRYELISTGGADTMKQQASCVLIEGRQRVRGIIRAADTGNTPVTAPSGSSIPALAIRLQSQYRKSKLIPIHIDVLHTSTNSSLKYEIYMFSDVTGGTWTALNNQSLAEVNTTPTSFSGGVKIGSGFLPAKATTPVGADFDSILSLTGNYDGTTHALVVVLTGIGNSTPCYASVTFKEVY